MTDTNPIVTWWIELDGRSADLARWEQSFNDPALAEVRREQLPDGDRHCLRSVRFDQANDVDIFAIASELVAQLNGALKLSFPATMTVRTRLPIAIRADGTRTLVARLVMDATFNIEFTATISTGNPAPAPKVSEPERWMSLRTNVNVVDALEHFARSDDWFDIFKVFEVIRSDVGEAAMATLAGTSNNKIDLLRQTANYYRHARTPRPVSPLPHGDAVALLRTIMRQWLAQKLSAP